MGPAGFRKLDAWVRRLQLLYAQNRHLTPRRLLNCALVGLEMRMGRTRLISRPYELCIDVSNKCNLTCPFCPTGRRENGRGRGNISYDTFTSIVDELAPSAFTLELFNWGEAFFDPELPRLIEYAYRKRLATMISSNLSFALTDEYIRAIIKSGLTYLTASVDGADQQSYEVYRRGGKFGLVMQNLRAFVRLKREMNSDLPRLCWQYLIFAHNEDRVGEARRLAAELGMDKFVASGGLYDDPSWAPRGDYSLQYLGVHPNRCTWLWTKAVFHWDGGMASCCMGFYKHDDFTDWEAGSFGRMWNSDKFIAARRIWTDRASALPQGHFCTDCDKVRLYRGLPLHSRMKLSPELRGQAAG
jgi:predicted transcriptional regulator